MASGRFACYDDPSMSDYRVNLDIYNGPLDLLLYLIRRDEIDIQDIPIARITEQYCAHVDMLKQIDPDLAGDFLVMAAMLLEIKTRMLLPRQEGVEEPEELLDPRSELVRQLLEYKTFKDAAGDLRQAALAQRLRFPRRPGDSVGVDESKDLEDVQIWDLVEAFNALLASVGQTPGDQEIIYDDTPIELHATDILDRLGRDGNMTFGQIFAGRTLRTELVGLFLALLELIRRQRVFVQQESTFGEIHVFLSPNPPAAAPEAAAQPQAAQAEPVAAEQPAPVAGQAEPAEAAPPAEEQTT